MGNVNTDNIPSCLGPTKKIANICVRGLLPLAVQMVETAETEGRERGCVGCKETLYFLGTTFVSLKNNRRERQREGDR